MALSLQPPLWVQGVKKPKQTELCFLSLAEWWAVQQLIKIVYLKENIEEHVIATSLGRLFINWILQNRKRQWLESEHGCVSSVGILPGWLTAG